MKKSKALLIGSALALLVTLAPVSLGGQATASAAETGVSAQAAQAGSKEAQKSTKAKLKPSTKKVTLKKGKSEEITLSYDGTDVTSKATWSTSDSKIATVKDGKITAVAKGKTKVKAKYKGKTATISVTVE